MHSVRRPRECRSNVCPIDCSTEPITLSETETVSADVQEEQIDIDEGTEDDDRR
jgi:hypothetical protein